MRKKAAILLVLLLCLSLAACADTGKNAETSGDPDTGSGTETGAGDQQENGAPEDGQQEQEPADDGKQDKEPEDSGTQEPGVDTQEQIEIIAQNSSGWYADDEFDSYNYAVTDLDQNGRLEIIVSICQGSGMFTYTDIYEVNEALDGLTKCVQGFKEGESQADIGVMSANCYLLDGAYYYVFNDTVRGSASELYENMRSICLENGATTERFLASRTTVYPFDSEDPTITIVDADGNELTDSEYESIGDIVYADAQRLLAAFNWVTDADGVVAAGDVTSITEFLDSSWSGFSLTAQ